MFKLFSDMAISQAASQTLWGDIAKRLNGAESEAVGPLKVLVVGGGPVGLAFATSLDSMMGRNARITVCDTRWKRKRGRIVWKGLAEGVVRRAQVVTLQSLVLSRLPDEVRAAVFATGRSSEVWPIGTGSPKKLGFPQNIAIRDIEDGLLELARAKGIGLVAERFELAKAGIAGYNLIVICDGQGSRTRGHFAHVFGQGDSAPFSIGGSQVEDVVLGLRVKARIPDADGVLLTVAQNRFLLNAHRGEGMLYMRLTLDEASEVRGRRDDGARFEPCIQSAPCVMQVSDTGFRCSTHGSRFVPAEDPNSFLWPRIREGLRLFDVPLEDFNAVTAFRLSMVRRGPFTGELTPFGHDRPVFGALLGDAAIGLSFWPGRGLNTGLSGAIALVRTLAASRVGRDLRAADFVPFEAAMAALSHRNQETAWRSMVMPVAGGARPVHQVIADALGRMDAPGRNAHLQRLEDRIRTLAVRLGPRLPSRPDADAIVDRLGHLETNTLAAFDEAGAWETRRSGGPEVDLDAIVPGVARKSAPGAHCAAS